MAASRADAIQLYRDLVQVAVALGKGDIEVGIQKMKNGENGIPPMPEFYAEGIRRRYSAEGEVNE